MFGLPEILGSIAGSGLASLFSGSQEDPAHAISKKVQNNQGDYYYTPNFVNQMNSILNNALQQAIDSSTGYTQTAVNTLQGSQQSATDSLQNSLQNALSQSQGLAGAGLTNYQTLQKPWSKAGYDAQDSYLQSLGLATPKGGSYNQVQAKLQAQQLAPLLKSLQGQYTSPEAPISPEYAATPDYNNILSSFSQDQINNAITPLLKQARRGGYNWNAEQLGIGGLTNKSYGTKESFLNNPDIQAWARAQLAQGPYNDALNSVTTQNKQLKDVYDKNYSTYQNTLNNYNTATNALQQYSPQQLQDIAANLKGLLG